jgi:hypothetical protein
MLVVGAGQYVTVLPVAVSPRVTMMIRSNWLRMGTLLVLATAAPRLADAAKGEARSRSNAAEGPTVEFFQAMDDGQVDAKFIAKNDRAARVIITNKTKQPLNVQMPAAFAGVPVLAQVGGGGFGGGGRGGGGFGGGGGGGQQSVGGGFGGGGGGGIGGGGGGGVFSIPPEETAKLNVPVVCLDHGLRNPSSSRPYRIVPADEHLDKPAVIELLKAFGSGELDHQSVQAAAWHLNNDMSWEQLAAKLQGTRRSPSRPPYFSRQQLQAGVRYANEATRLAQLNAESYEELKKQRLAKEKQEDLESSRGRSTSDEDATDVKSKVEESDDEASDAATEDSATADAG